MGTPGGQFRVDVRLLGRLELDVDGRPVHVGSPKQRAVLALLALHAGQIVASDTLCDLVWDEQQPASPSATLQSLISRLRAALGTESGGGAETGRDLLRTREPGWVLDVDPAVVDALRFRELTARARQRAGRDDLTRAADDLVEALALWRGDALVDVVDAGYLAPQATALSEARLDAVEDLAGVELAIGRTEEALARLESHVNDNPLRERGWAHLMVALYRLGRQTSALRAFQQVRTMLRDELGLEPSAVLVETEQRILRQDPSLAGPGATAGAHPPAPAHAGVTDVGGEFSDYSVVVVEDHDFQRRTVVQLLRALGVQTVADAPDASEALRILQAGATPDVIICDIDMPGMDGVEFVTRVAERGLASAVIIASGLDAKVLRAVEAIGESHGLHVLAALEKPLTARRLGDALRQYTRFNWDRANQKDEAGITGGELRSALERGELTAQFEPRIDLATGVVRSAEASGRWQSPGGAAIPASLFVPALTREGLVPALIERLVAGSADLLDDSEQAGLGSQAPVRVAVNVSMLPLADPSLAGWLTGLVEGRSYDPHRFVCEIDDLALARAPATALQVLTRLRVRGFGLSMNHTGVGPSMTRLLDRVPLSELKLDRRLVSGATSAPKRYEMLDSAMTSARDMGLPVVADGCDTQADFDTLLALACSEAQGRFIAEPMSATDTVAWALAGSRPNQLPGRQRA